MILSHLRWNWRIRSRWLRSLRRGVGKGPSAMRTVRFSVGTKLGLIRARSCAVGSAAMGKAARGMEVGRQRREPGTICAPSATLRRAVYQDPVTRHTEDSPEMHRQDWTWLDSGVVP